MNYFELFNIPIQCKVDTKSLKRKYFELSRNLHPDRNLDKRQELDMLEQSAMLNKAWTIFQNTDDTIKYILQIHGKIEENEKYNLDTTFLMEIMECKEAIMEAALEDDNYAKNNALQALDNLKNHLEMQLQQCEQELNTKGVSDALLVKIKDIYYKRKYVEKNSH